jgi:hypothetical protein
MHTPADLLVRVHVADILRCIETLDKRKKSGERTDLAPEGARSEPVKSARKTAELLGISPRQVERARSLENRERSDVASHHLCKRVRLFVCRPTF